MAYTLWSANTSISLGTVVAAASQILPTGLVFKCTTAGTTGGNEPAFGTDVGSTVTDGTVVWTAISSVFEDLNTFAPDKIIELFEITFSSAVASVVGVSKYYFHGGLNEGFTGNVVFNSNTYTAIPIKADGFERTSQGSIPRPTITIANLNGTISTLLKVVNTAQHPTNPSQTAQFPGNDLGNSEVRRITTLKKYLDGEPNADVNARFPDEIFLIDRKVSETRDVVQFELISQMDQQNKKIPKRQCIANVCQWVYRSSECSYTGTNYFDVNDQAVSGASNDVCGKRLSSCKARFGPFTPLPYGSFPSVGALK
tara:strand:- start:6491 stop:7426 length:936 start_codon:yes stop_codon:yes gene_type:complete